MELFPLETQPCLLLQQEITWPALLLPQSRGPCLHLWPWLLIPVCCLRQKIKPFPSKVKAGGLLRQDLEAKAQLQADRDREEEENPSQCRPALRSLYSTAHPMINHPWCLPPGCFTRFSFGSQGMKPTKKKTLLSPPVSRGRVYQTQSPLELQPLPSSAHQLALHLSDGQSARLN